MKKYLIIFLCLIVGLGFSACDENSSESLPEIPCADYCTTNLDFTCVNGECRCRNEESKLVNQKFCAFPGAFLAYVGAWHCIDTFGMAMNLDLAALFAEGLPQEGISLGGIFHERAGAQTSFPYSFTGDTLVFQISVPVSKDTESISRDLLECKPPVADGAACRLYLEGKATTPGRIDAKLLLQCEGGLRDSIRFEMLVVE